jgi:hypothetical protein
VLGRSVGSVKALQRRGLRSLRTRIELPVQKASEKTSHRSAPLRAHPAMTGVR